MSSGQAYIPRRQASSIPTRPSPPASQASQSPPRLTVSGSASSSMMHGARGNPELDQLEQIADEIEQLHKRKMSDALAELGYSSMVTSGFYASRAAAVQASSTAAAPKFTPPPPLLAGQVAKRRLNQACPAALPDSPRVDTFGR